MQQNYTIRTDVNSYTTVDVFEEVAECLEILRGFGLKEVDKTIYDVEFSTRARKFLGRCVKKSDHNFTIVMNLKYLRSAAPENVHSTIMHEAIHMMNGCFNHGEKWKNIAQRVNGEYPSFATIARTNCDASYNKLLAETTVYKYRVVCNGCQAQWKYQRDCRVISLLQKNGSSCICPQCNARNFTVISLR